MAWLQQDPSGNFHVSFRFAGVKYKRSLKTSDEAAANGIVARLEETIGLVERGRLEISPDADVPMFLLSDGKLEGKPKPPPKPEVWTLKRLLDAYFEALPEGANEPETIKGMRIHQRHLERILGEPFYVAKLTLADLQRYVEKRSKEKGLGGKVTATTIKKALVTLRTVWNWAARHGYVSGKFPNDGLRYPKSREKPPFMTLVEIQRKAEGLPAGEAKELYDALYLTRSEVGELLAHVKDHARHPFLFPMVCVAAHTGMRRAELLRCRVSDVDLQAKVVTVRERKKRHDKRTTRRVPLSATLAKVLVEWIEGHPGGTFLFCHRLEVVRSKTKRTEYVALTHDEANDHFQRALAGSKWAMVKGFHTLRHAFISACAAQGIDQRILDEWVGHQTEEQRQRYRHLYPSVQREAIDRVFG